MGHGSPLLVAGKSPRLRSPISGRRKCCQGSARACSQGPGGGWRSVPPRPRFTRRGSPPRGGVSSPGRAGQRTGESPISTPAEYSKRAKQSARAGNHDQAGDFYRLAGDWERANEMYLKGGHYDLAARLAEEMGDLPNAALFYLKSGDLAAAGEIELKQDNREKAAWMFNKAGQYARAAELLEALDQFAAAADNYRKGGFRDKAAILYVKAGKEALAASIFEELIEELTRQEVGGFRSEAERAMLLKYHRYCGELHMKLDRPEKAAPHFELALMYDQAAEAWQRAGHTEKAADILLRLQRPEDAFRILQESGRDISTLGPVVQAGMLARQGDRRGAADILEKAGSLYKAAEMWKEAGEPLRAAVLFEKEGETEQAADLYVRAGRHDEAARLFETARDFKNAADLYRKAGLTEEAARVYMKADDPIAAARL